MRVRVTLEYETTGHEESALSAVRCSFIGRLASFVNRVGGAGPNGSYSAKVVSRNVEKIDETNETETEVCAVGSTQSGGEATDSHGRSSE